MSIFPSNGTSLALSYSIWAGNSFVLLITGGQNYVPPGQDRDILPGPDRMPALILVIVKMNTVISICQL